MTQVSQELTYELLKRVHEDIGGLKIAVAELKAEMIGFRGSLVATQSDIHNIYGTLYRQDDRLDRIEKRLDLRELAEAGARFAHDA